MELTHDVFRNAKSFTELTASDVVEFSQTFLEEDSYLMFNTEIKDIFKKNEDVDSISILTYSGDILYDSDEEWDKQYDGEARMVEDAGFMTRVQSFNPSYLLEDGRVVYIKEDADFNEWYVDENERPVAEITEVDRVVNIVFPYDARYAVVYGVTYDALQERINATTERVLFLMLLGVVVASLMSYVLSSSIVKPVKELEAGVLKIATGDFKHRVAVKSKDELGILSKAFNKMAKDLDVSTKALIYKERVSKELELASKIQREILPKEKPVLDGYDIVGGLIPADEVGGDCFDFIHSASGDFYMYLGDVTGHGVSAGIVSSVANALLYSAVGFTSDPKGILVDVNKILKEKTVSNMFMTMVFVKICCSEGGKLQYVNAGHNRVLKFNASDGSMEELEAGGMALGMVADIDKVLTIQNVVMGKGDVLLLYSDGIPEAYNEAEKQYGMDNFKKAMQDYCDLETAQGIKNALLADVKEYMGKAVQADDMTVVVIKKV